MVASHERQLYTMGHAFNELLTFLLAFLYTGQIIVELFRLCSHSVPELWPDFCMVLSVNYCPQGEGFGGGTPAGKWSLAPVFLEAITDEDKVFTGFHSLGKPFLAAKNN